MGFGALRNIVLRPLARRLIASGASTTSNSSLAGKPDCRFGLGLRQAPSPPLLGQQQLWRHFSFFSESGYDRLTDTRLPNRRKRAGLRPAGAFAWVKYDAGEPIKPSNPNEGSVKRRNEKKRRMLHRAFVKGRIELALVLT
ncbi:unnamed protein product [Linum trigynum]|uniref:Uncharacterized protein n=1 Tax=Linum trigynum TaxID=586398 RepID=A0AAV2DFK0_9ROSI